jgi:hypothetical protein
MLNIVLNSGHQLSIVVHTANRLDADCEWIVPDCELVGPDSEWIGPDCDRIGQDGELISPDSAPISQIVRGSV